MSHFTVLVLGPNPEEKLAPYQENNMGDCPDEYLEFVDESGSIQDDLDNGTQKEWHADGHIEVTEAELNTLKNDSILNLKDKDKDSFDNKVYDIGDKISVRFEYPEKVWRGTGNQRWSDTVYAEIAAIDQKSKDKFDFITLRKTQSPKDIPLSAKYPTFKHMAEEYHGYKLDGETGKYGYWENPNSKWDWYQLGGRWLGTFKKKKGSEAELGSGSLLMSSGPTFDADSIKKGDVDWEGMNNDAGSKKELSETWEKNVVEKKGFRQPEYYTERYGNKENYIRMSCEFSTFAVITEDGEWHEAGTMGWWGMSDASVEDEKKFKHGFFDKFIKDLEDDTALSVYDCHI